MYQDQMLYQQAAIKHEYKHHHHHPKARCATHGVSIRHVQDKRRVKYVALIIQLIRYQNVNHIASSLHAQEYALVDRHVNTLMYQHRVVALMLMLVLHKPQ